MLNHFDTAFPDPILFVQAQEDALQILRDMESLKLAGQDYPSSSLLALRRVHHAPLLQIGCYAHVQQILPCCHTLAVHLNKFLLGISILQTRIQKISMLCSPFFGFAVIGDVKSEKYATLGTSLLEN